MAVAVTSDASAFDLDGSHGERSASAPNLCRTRLRAWLGEVREPIAKARFDRIKLVVEKIPFRGLRWIGLVLTLVLA
jgi:hypothetical protein